MTQVTQVTQVTQDTYYTTWVGWILAHFNAALPTWKIIRCRFSADCLCWRWSTIRFCQYAGGRIFASAVWKSVGSEKSSECMQLEFLKVEGARISCNALSSALFRKFQHSTEWVLYTERWNICMHQDCKLMPLQGADRHLLAQGQQNTLAQVCRFEHMYYMSSISWFLNHYVYHHLIIYWSRFRKMLCL